MINFEKIKTEDKKLYEKYSVGEKLCGCEMSFANLFLWGDQKIAEKDGFLFFFSTFSRSFYPFPLGKGDIKKAIEEIVVDAKERGIPCIISSVKEEDKVRLEALYPGVFEFTTSDGSYDYVYDIDNLADLPGKKYHKKRNHLAQFKKACPNYSVELIGKDNIESVKEMVKKWYEERLSYDPEADFDYEIDFFNRATADYEALGFIGLALICDGNIIAVTFASIMEEDTLDVHFEKAFSDVPGAYVAINNEFAKFVRDKYPKIKYLDREEDMGLEGLRKAKESYYPTSRRIKYRATKA